MKRFALLYDTLDGTTSTNARVQAMAEYFAEASAADAAWAVFFLAGGRLARLMPTAELRALGAGEANLPDWLFEASYQAVGDLAETLANVLPEGTGSAPLPLAEWVENRLRPLRSADPAARTAAVREWWSVLAPQERFVLNKLLTGGFRVGVSRQLVIRALAQAWTLDPRLLAARMIGYTDTSRSWPDAQRYQALIAAPGEAEHGRSGLPYPFFLAQSLEGSFDELGPCSDWQVEWKWDGIRAQLVRRHGQVWLWSRGEELLTERFPEIGEAAAALADGTVVDGELICWPAGDPRPLPFATLQTRITRKRVGPALLASAPAVLLAYDLLEAGGADLRDHPMAGRRQRLEALFSQLPEGPLRLAPVLPVADWPAARRAFDSARAERVEGLMLKRAASAYGVGRTRSDSRGDWLKMKLDPMSVDAVLVYAQAGHGRRASLYTDYTFAVWSGPAGDPARQLVPFAKAYSGLTDAEIREVDAIVRRHVRERFGPVRQVEPVLVFEIGFEGIARSGRHKSGIAVRFPRMLRWRRDKPVHEADTVAELERLLQ